MVGAYARSDRKKVKQDLDVVFNYFPPLKRLRHNISGYCSGGEQQMFVIGRALMASPRLILVDEPSLGLAPIVTDEIFEILVKIRTEEKMGILLVEQNARKALNIADYGYVMENGRIVLDGPSEKLRNNEDIKEFYLGFSSEAGKKSYHEVKHYKRRKRWLG